MKKHLVCLRCCRKAGDARQATRLDGYCEICNRISTVADVGSEKFSEITAALALQKTAGEQRQRHRKWEQIRSMDKGEQ